MALQIPDRLNSLIESLENGTITQSEVNRASNLIALDMSSLDVQFVGNVIKTQGELDARFANRRKPIT